MPLSTVSNPSSAGSASPKLIQDLASNSTSVRDSSSQGKRISYLETSQKTFPFDFANLPPLFTKVFDPLNCSHLQFSDLEVANYTFSDTLLFPGFLRFKVTSLLKLAEGSRLQALQGLFLKAKRIEIIKSLLKSDNQLIVQCDELDNSCSGTIEAEKTILLHANNVQNQGGSIQSADGQIFWTAFGKGQFDNTGGTVSAKRRIALGQADHQPKLSFKNHCGQLISNQSHVNCCLEFLENEGGTISAQERVGLDLFEMEPDLKQSSAEILRGKIISKKEGIYIATQRPLILTSHLEAFSGIEVGSAEPTRKGELLSSLKFNEPLSIKNRGSEDQGIALFNSCFVGESISIRAKGPIELVNPFVIGGGTCESSKGDVRVDCARWIGGQNQIRFNCGSKSSVKLTNSAFKQVGHLEFLSQEENKLAKPLDRLEMIACSVQATAFRALSRVCIVKKSAFEILKRIKIHTNQRLVGEETAIRASEIHFGSDGETLYFKRSRFISEVETSLFCEKGCLDFSGEFICSKDLMLSGLECLITKTNMVVLGVCFIAGDETILSSSDVVVRGKTFSLRGTKLLMDRENKIWTSRGAFAKTSKGKSFEVNSVHFVRDQDTFARAITSLRSQAIVHGILTTDACEIDRYSCSRTAERIIDILEKLQSVNQIDRASTVEIIGAKKLCITHGETAAQTLSISSDRVQIKNSKIESEQIDFNFDEGEFGETSTRFQNLQVSALSTLHLVDTLFGGFEKGESTDDCRQSIDLFAPSLHVKNSSFKARQIDVRGDLIDFSTGHIGGQEAKFASAHLFLINTAVDVDRFFLRGLHQIRIQGAELRGQEGQLIGDALDLDETHLKVETQLAVSAKSACRIIRSKVESDRLKVTSPNIELERAEIAALTEVNVTAKTLKGGEVQLSVRRGDAHFEAHFMSFDSLLGLLGGNLHFNAQVLQLINSQLNVQKLLQITAENRNSLIGSALKAQKFIAYGAHVYFDHSLVTAAQSVTVETRPSSSKSDHLWPGRASRHIGVKSSQIAAPQLVLNSSRIEVSESLLKAQKQLALTAKRIESRQSMLTGGKIALTAREIIALKTAFSSDQSIYLNAPLQLLLNNSLQAKHLIQQRGWALFGVQNQMRCRFFNQIALFSANIGNQREIQVASFDLSPLQVKILSRETTGLLAEIAPFAIGKWKTNQSAFAMATWGGFVGMAQGQIDAKLLHTHAIWHLSVKVAQISAEIAGALTSFDKNTITNSAVQGGAIAVHASRGDLKVRATNWQVEHLDLQAPGNIDLCESNLLAQQVIARANRIDQRRASVQAGMQVQASQLLLQESALALTDSFLRADDLQTDEKTLFSGPGHIELSFKNPQLSGQFHVEGQLEINAANPSFISNVRGACNVLKVRAAGSMRNLQPLIIRKGQIEVAKELQNENRIEGHQQLLVKTLRYLEKEGGALVASDMRLYQQEPIKTSELGHVKGSSNTSLSSDGEVLADREDQFDGALSLMSKGFKSDVKILAPLTVGGTTQMQGKSLFAKELKTHGLVMRFIDQATTSNVMTNDGLYVEGRKWDIKDKCFVRGQLTLRDDETNLGAEHVHEWTEYGCDAEVKRILGVKIKTKFHDWQKPHRDIVIDSAELQVVGSADINGKIFRNIASSLYVKGPTQLKVDEFLSESKYHNPDLIDQNRDRPLPVHRAQNIFDGDLNAEIAQSAKNIGGLFAVTGESNFSAKELENINLAHDYRVLECVGAEVKRTCGVKRRTKFLHDWRTYTVVDSPALFLTKELLNLNIADKLINSGVMRAGRVAGRIGDLNIGHQDLNGQAPKDLEPWTGLPLATIFSQGDLHLEVQNHSDISGRLQAAGNFHFSTKSLDLYRKEHEVMEPFTRSRGWKSDRSEWKNTSTFDRGGELIGGKNATVLVDGHLRADLGTIEIAQDLQLDAKSIDLNAGKELTKVDLPGKSGFLQSRDQHAQKTTFHPSRIRAGGRVDIIAKELLRNSGSEIEAGKGGSVKAGELEELVPMAINCVSQDRGLTYRADRHEGVSAVPKVTSREGNVEMSISGDAQCAGDKVAAGSVHLDAEGEVTFNTASQSLPQSNSKLKWDGLSISKQTIRAETLHAVPPTIRGKEIRVTSKKKIVASGAQFDAERTIAIKTPILEWGTHEFALNSSTSGWELGLSFPGSRPMKSLLKDQSLKKATKELILSDPLVNKSYQLLKAQDGEEVALCTMMVATEGFKSANALSLAKENGQLTQGIGQRMGLLDGEGRLLSPKLTFFAQQFSQSETVRDQLPGLLRAGESITIQAQEQTYTGADLSAKSIAFLGIDGQKTKATFQSSQRSVEQTQQSEGASITLNSNGSMGLGTNCSEGASSSTTQRNTRVTAEKIDWNASQVEVHGANIHGDQQTGSIDHIHAESRYDHDQSRSENYSFETSGNVASGSHHLDRRTINQSTFTANKGGASGLKVGKITAIGAAFDNINADEIEGRDLLQTHIEKNRQISLNLPEVAAFAQNLSDRASGSGDKSAAIEPFAPAIDPRSKKSIYTLGNVSYRSTQGEALARATVAGTSLQQQLNTDWNKRQDPLELKTKHREVDLIGVDTNVLSQQFGKLRGKSDQYVKDFFKTSEKLDQISKSLEELEDPEALTRAIAQEIVDKTSEEEFCHPQFILASSDGQSSVQQREHPRGRGIRIEHPLEYDDIIFASYTDYKAKLAKQIEAYKKLNSVDYSRQIKVDDLQSIDRKTAKNQAHHLKATVEMLQAHGTYLKGQMNLWVFHLNRAKNPQEKEIFNDQVIRLEDSVLKVSREANDLLANKDSILNALQIHLRRFFEEERIDDIKLISAAQKKDITEMLNPLEEVNRLAEGAIESKSRAEFLCQIPGGDEIEVDLQIDPRKFADIQSCINEQARQIITARVERIYNKQDEDLSLEDRLMLDQGQVMRLTDREIPWGGLIEMAKKNSTTVEAIQALIRWRNCNNPNYFEELMSNLISEVDIARSRPLGNIGLIQSIQHWLNPGEGTTVGFEELHENDIRLEVSKFGIPIDFGLRKITDQERISGIWIDGRKVKHEKWLTVKELTHWSTESGLTAILTPSVSDSDLKLSTLVGKDSPGELLNRWAHGTNLGVSYISGINTKIGYAYADCLNYTKKIKADFGVLIRNPTRGLTSDVIMAGMTDTKFGYMSEAALETRRVMFSFRKRNPDAEHIHFCHSNGALHTNQALASLPEHIRKKIIVIAIGPQCLISDDLCKKVYHIGSERDWVYSRAIQNRGEGSFSNIEVCKSEIKRDWDHTQRSETLKDSLDIIFRIIKEKIL